MAHDMTPDHLLSHTKVLLIIKHSCKQSWKPMKAMMAAQATPVMAEQASGASAHTARRHGKLYKTNRLQNKAAGLLERAAMPVSAQHSSREALVCSTSAWGPSAPACHHK
jgi:hypothetical protein